MSRFSRGNRAGLADPEFGPEFRLEPLHDDADLRIDLLVAESPGRIAEDEAEREAFLTLPDLLAAVRSDELVRLDAFSVGGRAHAIDKRGG